MTRFIDANEASMDFGVYCECGQFLPVAASDAGSALSCACGRPLVVPLLAELQARGKLLSAATIERRIQRMKTAGELPITGQCARCGDNKTAHVVNATVECERYRTRSSGGYRFLIVPGFWLFWEEEQRMEILGRDTSVPALFCLCSLCKAKLRGSMGWAYLLVGILLLAVSVLVPFLNLWVGIAVLVIAIPLLLWLPRLGWKRRQHAYKALLRQVPVYGQLLDRYPHAVVVISRR